MKVTKHDLFMSVLKIRLEDCVNFVTESNKLHNTNLDFIPDELSTEFYNELNAIEFSINFGVINTYSLFDFFLSAYCNKLQHYSWQDLSNVKGENENIKRAKIIYSIINFDIRKHANWKKIDDYRKIRNLLIHNNLNIYSKNNDLKINPDRKTKDLIKTIMNNPYLQLDNESGKISIENIKYVVSFKNIVLELFDELINELNILDLKKK